MKQILRTVVCLVVCFFVFSGCATNKVLKAYIVTFYVNLADSSRFQEDAPPPKPSVVITDSTNKKYRLTDSHAKLVPISGFTYLFEARLDNFTLPYSITVSLDDYITQTLEDARGVPRITLQRTPESLERDRLEAEVREAARQAARQEEQAQRRAARELAQNPDNLDRSQYRETDLSDFNFNMSAGRLPVGSKVYFRVRFAGRPTSTTYHFIGVNPSITFTSRHNLIRGMSDSLFDGSTWVKIYVTVQSSTRCTVDIIDWPDGW